MLVFVYGIDICSIVPPLIYCFWYNTTTEIRLLPYYSVLRSITKSPNTLSIVEQRIQQIVRRDLNVASVVNDA
jgi:hypothetical protein